jgi:acyl dehydratase
LKTIRYDDIAALAQQVTGEFGPWSDPVRVTQDMIDRFADLSGDDEWIHVDVERARRESPFGGPIAHGFLTVSLFPKVRPGGGFEIVGHGNRTNYGVDRMRFLSPVPAGSSVQARSRFAEARAREGGTVIAHEVEVRVVESGALAMVCRPLVIYMHPVPVAVDDGQRKS